MNQIFKAGLLAFAGLVCAGAAHAQVGGYIGARVGDSPEDRFGNVVGNVETDTPYGIYGGWNFHPNWGIEVSYSDLGTSEVSGIADGGFRVDGDLATLGLVYNMPLNDNFSLLAGVGGFDLSEDGTAFTIAGPQRLNLDDSGVYIEVGARYRFNGPIAIRASYQWFDFERDTDGIPTIGAEFNF